MHQVTLVVLVACVVNIFGPHQHGDKKDPGMIVLLKSHVHPAQYVDGVRTSMRYLQTTCSVDLVIVLFRVGKHMSQVM